MSNGRMMQEFGGLTPSENLKELDKLKRIIEVEPDISDDLEIIFKKRGKELPDFLKKDPIFEIKPRPLPIPFDPVTPLPLPRPPIDPPAKPTPEIDTEMRLLLNAIPEAHPGNIITSNFHNTLRAALIALASRIGIESGPGSEFKILTFAPAFLPLFSQPIPGSTATGAANPNRWDVTLTRAAVTVVTNIQQPVSGGMAVQLPDGARIFQMIVRGTRLGSNQPAPREMTVTFKRVKLGKDAATNSETLIALDLKSVKDGAFEVKESVKLTDAEADRTTDTLAGLTIAGRRVVDNEKWIYYVTADWQNADPNGNSAKYEIGSIQIICKV